MIEVEDGAVRALELQEGDALGFAVVGRGATTAELLRLVEGRQALAVITWNVEPGESLSGYLVDLAPGLYATRVRGDGCAVLSERTERRRGAPAHLRLLPTRGGVTPR